MCRYKQRVVWDKQDRMDLIFGSSPGLLALANPGSDSGTNSDDSFESEILSELRDEKDMNEEIADQEMELGEDQSEGDSWDETGNRQGTIEDGVSTYTDDAFDSTYDTWDDEDIKTKKSKNLKIEDVIETYSSWLKSRDLKMEEENTKTFFVFCDLDGVLVDFEAGVRKLFKNKKTAGIIFLFFILISSALSMPLRSFYQYLLSILLFVASCPIDCMVIIMLLTVFLDSIIYLGPFVPASYPPNTRTHTHKHTHKHPHTRTHTHAHTHNFHDSPHLKDVMLTYDQLLMYQYSSIISEISPKLLWPRLASTPDFYALLPWMEGTYLEYYSAYSYYFYFSLFHFFLSLRNVPSVSFSPYSINQPLSTLFTFLAHSLSLFLSALFLTSYLYLTFVSSCK